MIVKISADHSFFISLRFDSNIFFSLYQYLQTRSNRRYRVRVFNATFKKYRATVIEQREKQNKKRLRESNLLEITLVRVHEIAYGFGGPTGRGPIITKLHVTHERT